MDSFMEDSMFDDGSGSDFGSPAATKAKPAKATGAKGASKAASKPAPKKPTAPKAAPKKAAQGASKAKPAAGKKRAKAGSDDENDDHASDMDNDSMMSNTPPSAKKPKKAAGPKKMGAKPLREVENEAIREAIDASLVLDGTPDAKPKKGAKSTEQYQKLTQLEHIIKRPDTYIGSVEMQEHKMWVYNSELESMEMRTVNFVPGLYKIFDEILVNAADNKQRDKNMDTVKVTIEKETGKISVLNNGRGIPIEIHEKEKIYIPEMIFGHLLTSSNYDDDQEKVTGGRNGYGAKLCNVFSTEFSLETVDSRQGKKYKQTWTDHMSKMGKASITQCKGDDFTKITFHPDYQRFKMEGIDDDLEALLKRRVYDLAGTSKGVKVYLNGERLKISNFKKYMELYTKAIKRERGDEAANDNSDIVTDNPDPRWEVGFAVSDGTFQQVSFVNSIATTTGGTHVNYIADQVSNRLLEHIKKKKNNKVATLKSSQIRNHIFIFVNCLIVNPAFTSQTKEQLTTKSSQFGSKVVLGEDFMRKIMKTDVIENILHFAEQKADQILKKSDGSRRSRMDNPKLTDANKAGTKDGYKCTLILTEGDSAKGLAVAGRSVVSPDYFGVYPLRGKLLNVRDASIDQISKNQEIQNIKNFLGLKHKQTYEDCKSLRYGHLMIMTDQDHDGSHIKGLLINFLQVQYPSLLKIPEFLVEFITPIVKVWKGDPKHPKAAQYFFTMPEYEAFKEVNKHDHRWEHKYYKGLGTSSTLEAQMYFRDLDKHLKEFHTMKDSEAELIDLVFSKKKADERKEWLRQFKPGTYLDHSERQVSYSDFVNKELILFSMTDNFRSIPSVLDGLKPGQRKVLFTCFHRNLRKDTKVVELAGSVSGLTAYQYGDTSLQGTIVGLAQNFVGSNNVNCLEPSGNFGSRLQGGSDAASPRYIYTRLSAFARKVFNPADEPLLSYNTDDGKKIEPENYMPVVPLILLNGADGIGTGWSSSIPNYNPEDVVENLKLMMQGQEIKPMIPWFRGFKGTITQLAPDKFKFSGIIKQINDHEVEITELPVRMWTQDFKDKIVDIIKAEKGPSWIKDYDDYNTIESVNFVVRMDDKSMKASLEEGLEERFKITKTMTTSNLVAFDPEGRITKYATVEDMLKEFYAMRIKYYEKRKAHMLSELKNQLEKFSNQARFVQMIIDGKLVVSKKKKAVLVQELKDKNFKPIPKVKDNLKENEQEDPEKEEEQAEEDAAVGAADYDYLLGMPIWSLTKERVEKLLNQVKAAEEEMDALIKLTKEDLWMRDLDDFLAEWRFQLDDERKARKKLANMGRRGSAKLHVGGAAGRKRKGGGGDSDDSDFEVGPKSKKAAKPKGGLLGDYFGSSSLNKNKPSPKSKGPSAAAKNAQKLLTLMDTKPDPAKAAEVDIWMNVDGVADAPKQSKPTAPMKKPPVDEGNSYREEEAVQRVPTERRARAAATKAKKYSALNDSDSDGDDMLFNVGNMVKGIDTTAGGKGESSSRPLFRQSMSRPGSSAGLPKRPTSSHRQTMDFSPDETDYSKLVPASAKRLSTMPDHNARGGMSEDESTMADVSITDARGKKKKAAPAKGVKRAPAASKAKQESDAEAEEEAAPSRRPKRAAAVASKSKWVMSDEDDDDSFGAGGNEFDESD